MSSLEGINGTVFMYGQTGAGKTFTMLGSAPNRRPETSADSPSKGRNGSVRRSASQARRKSYTIYTINRHTEHS